jgi:dTDP-4-dehydrorhamnose 3,5-epimerase
VKFIETKLKGAFVIELERLEDARGFFARTFSQQEFQKAGLDPYINQCSLSFNTRKGTLRGMHYQAAPFEETKVVRCIRGSFYDVIIDLRPDSLTFKQYVGVLLSAENRHSLYIPHGFAHGLQTLEHDTEILYQISQVYSPEHQRGVRWNDPAFGIQWPDDERIIIPRDAQYPDFRG